MNYKVFISAICIILALLVLTGCKSPSTPDTGETTDGAGVTDIVYDDNPVSYNVTKQLNIIQYSDGFLYFKSYESGRRKHFWRNSDLFKYNPATEQITFVCKDALCDHTTSECPLYGNLGVSIYKDRIFYDRSYKNSLSDGKTEIFMGFVSYDMIDGKLKELQVKAYEVAETPSIKYSPLYHARVIFTGNSYFYSDSDYVEALDTFVRTLKRMDIDTGEITVLHTPANAEEKNIAEATSMLFCVDNRLYFTDAKSMYSTDLDYKDKKTVAEGVFGKDTVTNGKVIVWKNSDTNELHAMNMDGSNSRSLGIKASDFNLNEKNLYYFSDTEIELGIVAEVGVPDYLKYFEFFKYSFETEKSEQLLNLKNDDDGIEVIDWVVLNNCLYGRYQKWTFPKAGEILSYERHRYSGTDTTHVNTILRIDIETGAQSFIELAVN